MSTAYLTRRQVAERLGVSEGTLANWSTQGKGPKCVRLGARGGRVRYPAEAYFEWERALNESTS
jgi:predicted DNA-binding transcriptional regulator AlpA